ncbi:MAG: TonB-dependent receptor [Bacteroidota bacterium]|nr:TonB-dependent receptor [Bacteroidota bacterium]
MKNYLTNRHIKVKVMPFLSIRNFFLIFLIFLFATENISAAQSGTKEEIFSIHGEMTVLQVFKQIEQKSKFIIVYRDGTIDLNRKVKVNTVNKSVSEILDLVFAGTNNTYEIKDRQITIHNKPVVRKSPNNDIRVSGTVLDKEKNALPGVSVKVVGEETSRNTVSDVDGHFYLNVPDKSSVIEFSYIGYKTQRIKVGNEINFSVILEEDVKSLNEVVVTGYGSQKKLSVVGAIETLEPQKLQVGSTRSLSNNLAGQVAGLIAVTRSGEPGYDNSNFWIRGIASFSGTTTPLVLVDGIERDLNNIDPSEIESFSVLKDASASAMYGVRGANGVIIINTKRGSVGPPTVDLRVEHSISEPTQLPQFIGGADYMELLNELKEDKSQLPYSQEQIDKTRYGYDKDLYPDVNWMDEITKKYAYSTRSNLTVSGGSNFLRYSLVASLYNEQGIVATDKTLPYDTDIKLNRYNMRSNVDLDITKTTTLRLNVGGYLQNRHAPNCSIDDLFSDAFTTSPIVYPARYSDGTIPVIANRVNPWALGTQSGYQININTQLQSLFSLEQNLKMLTPGLKAKFTFSFDSYNYSGRIRNQNPTYYNVATGRDEEGNLTHTVLSYGDESLGFSNSGGYGTKNMYLEGNMTYNRTFGKHDIDALFLYNQQSYDDGSVQPYRKQGIAGRLSYVYDRRYITEVNFGYNGSENFAKGQRFGFFPSLALGWLISEEPFMQSFKGTISKMKLRGSYGKVGNDNIGGRRFAYITTIYTGQGSYQWGDNGQVNRSGITEGDIGVNNLTWETSWKSDLGYELGLWNGAFELQVDLFKEKRSNIFMQRSTIPTQAGYITTPWANYGKVTNRGVDASLNYNKKIDNDWSVGLRSTFSYAINKIDEIDEPEGRIGTYRAITGRSMNTLWGLQAERLFTTDDFDANGNLKFGIPAQSVGAATVRPGDIKYKDMNGDGIITDADEGYIGGTADPRIVYGFGGSIVFRNWDLNVFFQGVGDTHRIIGGSSYFLPGSGQGLLGNIYSNYQDRWTEENQSQNVFWPRLSESPNQQNYRASTWWKKDMSFLRCKTIEMGYSLPKSMINKLHSNNIRLYISGNNLFCISKFKMWDPELASGDGLKYPPMRSVMFGLDLNF